MALKSEQIVASGEWKSGDSPMKRILANPDLLARFETALQAVNERQARADVLACQTSIGSPG